MAVVSCVASESNLAPRSLGGKHRAREKSSHNLWRRRTNSSCWLNGTMVCGTGEVRWDGGWVGDKVGKGYLSKVGAQAHSNPSKGGWDG